MHVINLNFIENRTKQECIFKYFVIVFMMILDLYHTRFQNGCKTKKKIEKISRQVEIQNQINFIKLHSKR